MKMNLTVLDPKKPEQAFPPVEQALKIPDGLLAVGGCLSKTRLLHAYRHGVFPWNSADEPILWWSPDPRLILFPKALVLPRSLVKTLRQQRFAVTFDRRFNEVMIACASPRKDGVGTWITPDILSAYQALFDAGYAHSVEAWLGDKLVGGLYGVALGQVFFGESMFFLETDASKVAFATLAQSLEKWGFKLIDCQVSTQHLKNFGAEEISRRMFIDLLNQYCEQQPSPIAWRNI